MKVKVWRVEWTDGYDQIDVVAKNAGSALAKAEAHQRKAPADFKKIRPVPYIEKVELIVESDL